MGFGHEKLDVYRATIEYVGWVYRFCRALSAAENASRKALLDRIVAMQTKLGQRGYAVFLPCGWLTRNSQLPPVAGLGEAGIVRDHRSRLQARNSQLTTRYSLLATHNFLVRQS